MQKKKQIINSSPDKGKPGMLEKNSTLHRKAKQWMACQHKEDRGFKFKQQIEVGTRKSWVVMALGLCRHA